MKVADPQQDTDDMTLSTEFDLAQKRLKERQRMQTFLILWLAGFFGALILNVLLPDGGGIWLSLAGLSALLAGSNALQLRYSSPKRTPRIELIEAEMGWLFGEDWRDVTDAQEYAFAQNRIRQRLFGRFKFLLHLVIFVSGGAYLVLVGTFLLKYGESVGKAALIMPIVWFVGLIIPHALRAFPTKGMLRRRERKVGQELSLELRNMQPEKLKNEEKTKRDVQYAVGDDGELVEVDEKLKRDEA